MTDAATRWALRIAACTLAGVLATVAAAWAPAIVGPGVPAAAGPQHYVRDLPRLDRRDATVTGTAWAWWATRHHGLAQTTIIYRKGLVNDQPPGTPPRRSTFEPPPWAPVPDRGMRVDRNAYGWPLHALGASFTSPDATHDFLVLRRGRVMPSGDYRHPVRVPIIPIWPGLVLDVVAWTALAMAVLLAFAALRTRRRLRRGLCPRCAYEVGIDAPERCSECGTRWPRRARVVP